MVKIISNRKPGRFVYLPDEILIDIISRVAEAQRTLVSCALVSIQWYHVTMPFLYGHPRRLEKNQAFDQFVRTILGVGEATTATVRRRRNDLASLVRILDLSRLIHHSTNSLTAKLINAVKDGLKAFAAPSLSLTYVLLNPSQDSSIGDIVDADTEQVASRVSHSVKMHRPRISEPVFHDERDRLSFCQKSYQANVSLVRLSSTCLTHHPKPE